MCRVTIRWTITCACLGVVIGCGRSERAAVHGRVLLDGATVDGGMITFVPATGDSRLAAWAEIKAGRYFIPAKTGPAVGACRVEIRWSRKTGKMVPLPGTGSTIDEIKDAIPVRYNGQSKLRTDMKPGKNEVNFELESK
jgi:hypothetical protein